MKQFKCKSKFSLALLTLVRSFFVTLIALSIIFAIYIQFSGYPFSDEKFEIVCIVALIISLIRTFGFKMIQIVITDKEIQFLHFGKIYASFPKDESHFETSVVKNYFSGVYVGAKRYIIVTKDGETETEEMQCYNISKKDFSQIMTILSTFDENTDNGTNKTVNESINNEIGTTGNTTKELYSSPNIQSIDFPREEFIKENKKMFNKSVIRQLIVLIITFIIALVSFGISDTDMLKDGYEIFVGVVLVIIFVILPFLIFFAIRNYSNTIKDFSKVPRKISVDNSGLRIDNFDFLKADIKEIKMQPPEYVTKGTPVREKSFLTIKTLQGTKKFFLGNPVYWVYNDHEVLSKMIKEWCNQNGITFIFTYK